MRIDLTPTEIGFLIDLCNECFHDAEDRQDSQSLGDIERNQFKQRKDISLSLIHKLEAISDKM